MKHLSEAVFIQLIKHTRMVLCFETEVVDIAKLLFVEEAVSMACDVENGGLLFDNLS